MKVKKTIITLMTIILSQTLFSQTDTCEANFCYIASSDTNNTLTVSFTNLSFSNPNIVSWIWDFGDGNTSMYYHPVYTYSTQDSFIVTLTIISASSCIDSYIDTISLGNTCTTSFPSIKEQKNNISIFPTIVNDNFKILINYEFEKLDFYLYNELGEVVFNKDLLYKLTEICKLNIPNGIYFYKIEEKEKLIKTGKLIFDTK